MKPTGQRWRLDRNNNHQLEGLIEHIKLKWVEGKDVVVQFMSDDRTPNQNAMIYALYGDIARQSEAKTTLEVRRECKLHYGVPILRASSEMFCQWYDRSIKPLNYEDKLLLMDHFDVTSDFTKEQATEYLNTIIQEYTNQGFRLDAQA